MSTAMLALEQEARTQAEECASEFQGPDHTDPDTAWRFWVSDARLVAGHAGGAEAWVAIGTLVSQGAHAWDSNYWRDH
jgi:hypothetical protein